MDVTPPDDDLKGVIMKYNNVETLATALESAVSELVEVKAQLAQARADRNTFRSAYLTQVARAKEAEAKCAEARAELFDTQEELTVAEMKLARLEKYHEHNFDYLVHEYGWQHYTKVRLEEEGDVKGAAKAEGAAYAIEHAINITYERYLSVFHDSVDPMRLLIEIWDGENVVAYWHWHADCPMGQFRYKVEVK